MSTQTNSLNYFKPTPIVLIIPDTQWQHIANSLTTAATFVLGYEKQRSDKPWYDDEYREMSEEIDARQPIATDA